MPVTAWTLPRSGPILAKVLRRRRHSGLFLPLLAASILGSLGGCGHAGGRSGGAATSSGFPPAADKCDLLPKSVVAQATGVLELTPRYISPTDPRVVCDVVFFQVGGQGVFHFTQGKDDPALFGQLRRARIATYGAKAVRPVAGVGDSAYLAQPGLLAVRKGNDVYAFEAFLPSAHARIHALRAVAKLVLGRSASGG